MTDKYAVIGNPISHSKSPLIHRMFAAQTGQDISYEAIEAPLDGFAAKIDELRALGYKGCNVTVPFKLQASNLTPFNSQRAQDANAANTLTFKGEKIIADNTDGVGLVRDIELNHGFILQGKRVLLMGAGGAARGVQMPLVLAKIQSMVIANRSRGKADEMLMYGHKHYGELFNVEMTVKNYSDLGSDRFDIVINATSAGLSDSTIPLPDTIFAPNALAYDMMYGRETPFMAFARQHGVRVADGLGMLVEQAAEAFFIWRGVRPDTQPVLEKFRSA